MDPRLSNTASQADYWLPTYPGSEAAVLLAMAKVLLDEGLADLDLRRALDELAGLPGGPASGRRARRSRASWRP